MATPESTHASSPLASTLSHYSKVMNHVQLNPPDEDDVSAATLAASDIVGAAARRLLNWSISDQQFGTVLTAEKETLR